MTFLKPLQDTKLSALRLLDLSYIVVLLPLLLSLKVPMLVFLLTVIVILSIKKTPANNYWVIFIFLFGVVAVYLSMYGAFSFRGLSRLKLFIELLVYILIVVVSMQRITHKINFYLIISPFLFLALSLFFYHGMAMLAYVIFEIFFLLWMILAHRIGGDLTESFRASMVMFMYSLPWVVILFIFFPRISFEHANYGFKGETTQRMGHDGTMHVDDKALLVPSDRIVMEVGFEKKIPSPEHLYFRGSTLYIDNKNRWEPLPHYLKRENKIFYATKGEKVNYKVTLYPTQKRWIYLLDMPAKAVDKSTLDPDLISMVEKPIKEPLHYAATSSLGSMYYDDINENILNAATTFDDTTNPKSYETAQKLKKNYPDVQKRVDAIVHFFKQQRLTYTLKPKPLDLNNSTDSFLFDTKLGYCVHFASSFVTMSRMAGIPSRVVTGYKADLSNAIENYIAIKERDAHAWAEIYMDGHWVRIEATSTASTIEAQSQDLLNGNKKEDSTLLGRINLYLMYVKYQIETWILYYSHIRQLQLLDYAKNNPIFIIKFVTVLLLFILAVYMLLWYLKKPTYSTKTLEIIQPLLNKMKKEGYIRRDKETLHQYLLRYAEDHPKHNLLVEIDLLYEKLTYGNQSAKSSLMQLKHLVKESTKKNS